MSANRSNRVLLLEAGPVDRRWDFRIHMPAALSYPLVSRDYNWWYDSEPEPSMHGRRIYHPRGKVLGGSSCINGMIYIRGNAMDFEKWSSFPGLENWSYAHCLPYFRRLEHCLKGGDDYRGAEGPVYLTWPDCANPLYDAFFLDLPLVCHLPGVGRNLQDHLEVYVQYACREAVSLFPALSRWSKPKIGIDWLLRRTGIGASNQFEAGGFIRSNSDVDYPNLQYHFLPVAIPPAACAGPASSHRAGVKRSMRWPAMQGLRIFAA
ncbi:MAG: GMC family oxidoreductase N-terminal domain-containing protein [Woeseia sp.]